MSRIVRMIAPVTISLWVGAALAEGQPAGETGTPTSSPAVAAPPPAPAAPSATVQPPAGSPPAGSPSAVLPPAVLPPGTPATVLDAQDYEVLLGKGVRSVSGEELGRVIDVIIDKDGRPRAAIIDFGGFLGVGSRKIAVDWRALRFVADGKPSRVLLQLSRNQVRVSPEYKSGEPIVVLGPASPSASGDPDPAAATAAAQTPPSSPAQPPAGADKPAADKPDKAPDR